MAGVGVGCGTHNESTSTVDAIFDQTAYATTEYEFTVRQAGARANGVYYFRLYDLTVDEVVGLDSGATYPSLVVEGPQLISTLTGVSPGTAVAGIVTDIETTPTSISFGTVPFGSSFEAAQQLSVTTNATEGYQMLVYATQQLTDSYGNVIPPIDATNDEPAGWSTACQSSLTGCFGYHTTDATLSGGSTRFAPEDSYSAIDTSPQEIMYSSVPTIDAHMIVYRIFVTTEQPAGQYETGISYVSIPVF